MACENTLGLEGARPRCTTEPYEFAVVERAAQTGSRARISELVIELKVSAWYGMPGLTGMEHIE